MRKVLPALPIVFAFAFGVAPTLAEAAIIVSPASVLLDNPEASQQLLVRTSDSPVDLTRRVVYEVRDPNIAGVDAKGLVQPKSEGRTFIVVRNGQEQVQVAVEVSGLTAPPPVAFESQVVPILSKNGCNSGGCHGKAEGKNGFKLSVFGFDTVADYQAFGNGSSRPPRLPEFSGKQPCLA